VRGLFLSGRVGVGKTLTAGLAPTVLQAKRPLLITDACAVGSTKKLLGQYRQHWRIAPINVVSYNKISVRSAAQKARIKRGEDPGPGFLDIYDPDCLLLDEAHLLKRVKSSARARRTARWIHQHPGVPICAFSGTPVRDSLVDYAWLLVATLKLGAPVPLDPDDQEQWALLLDTDVGLAEDALVRLYKRILWPHLGEVYDQDEARQAYQHRLLWTPGVVVSQDSFEEVPLTISPVRLETPECLTEHWETLRDAWMAPDEWPLPDKQLGVYNVANQLALGFYYRHDPRPPLDWMAARRDWCGFCRKILEVSETLDTEVDVRNACLAGRLPREIWDVWDAIRGTYTPQISAEWLSLHALHTIEQWGRRGGIIWVDYRAVGEALAERTGWPFYATQGRDRRGLLVEDARSDRDPTIIVSTKAAEVGLNLQGGPDRPGYSRGLFTTPPRASTDWEQRIGRWHRDGQSHACEVCYLVGCREHWVAMPQSLALAEMAEKSLMPSQKLLRWDAQPPPVEWAVGAAYEPSRKEKKEKKK
jgi:hypothetical protein